MKTIFNQETLTISAKSGGGTVDYSYKYFKEGFEEWAEKHDASLPDADQLKEYIIGSGYRVIEITERDNLEELLDESKELIEEDITLSKNGDLVIWEKIQL